MGNKEKTHRYIEWISPEDMHAETIQWLSELKFFKDEQQFLNMLVKHYTHALSRTERFQKSKTLVSQILEAEKELEVMLQKIQVHENQLDIMVDDVDQPTMERAYKETHKELTHQLRNYFSEYQRLKKELFDLITSVMKKEKQHRLLN